MFVIKLENIIGTSIEALNQKLYDLGWNQKKHGQPFRDKEYFKWQFQDFFNNVNNCAKKDLAYAKQQRLMLTGGEDRDCTYDECLAVYGSEMKENQLYLDIKFSRADKKTMIACAMFASGESNQKYIDWIKNGADLLEKAELTLDSESQAVIEKLERVDKAPELLPKAERMDRSIQGGTMLAKYWSPAPNNFVHIIFGNVEDAVFLKDRQHVEPIYDNLYKCDDKRAVLMVPQIPFGQKGVNVAKEAFHMAATLGVQENPCYFIHMIWKNAFTLPKDKASRVEIANSFAISYSVEELKERFMNVVSHLNNHYPTYRCVKYSPSKLTHDRFSYSGTDQNSVTGILNCLFLALWKTDRKAAHAVAMEAPKVAFV